jgi:hypothetical protein
MAVRQARIMSARIAVFNAVCGGRPVKAGIQW